MEPNTNTSPQNAAASAEQTFLKVCLIIIGGAIAALLLLLVLLQRVVDSLLKSEKASPSMIRRSSRHAALHASWSTFAHVHCGSVPRISVRKPIRLEIGQKLAGTAV